MKNKNFISNSYDNNSKSKNIDEKNSSLLLKPSEHLKYLVNQFNNMSSLADDINSDNPENIVLSKYYDVEELQNLNACSPSETFDDLQHLLSCTIKTLTSLL